MPIAVDLKNAGAFAAHKVTKVVATQNCRTDKCEIAINIGIFFDGTGNAIDGNGNSAQIWQHEQQRKQSNVARLFRAYPDRPDQGFYRTYVPGLGTPFPQIGEQEPATMGEGFGSGGDGRINYGLLQVFNAVHRAISLGDKDMFAADTMHALCANGKRTRHTTRTGGVVYSRLDGAADEAALDKIGRGKQGGLLMTTGGDRSEAKAFYAAQAAKLANLITNVAEKPVLKEIFIDVFGFSRGAVQARTFCTWLDGIFAGSTLFGVATQIRFLGLFDSVASVGMNASAGVGAQGHLSWADAPYMQIAARIKHCEHYIAMHENRASFPVEDVRRPSAKEVPVNCYQCVFPGMHADVGGGYWPTEQGRWIDEASFGEGAGLKLPPPIKIEPPAPAPFDARRSTMATDGTTVAANHRTVIFKPALDANDMDSRKLSQMPLNSMFNAAVKANVPLNKKLARDDLSGYDPFVIHPLLQRAFDEFNAVAGGEKSFREWLIPYLAWRYQVRDTYAQLSTTKRSKPVDKDDLTGANNTFLLDIQAVEKAGFGRAVYDGIINGLKGPLKVLFGKTPSERFAKLAPEATTLLARLKAHPAVDPAMARMFQYLCHDSYAGFKPFDKEIMGLDMIPGSWEAEGYLRYRRSYQGNDSPYASLQPRKANESAIV